MAVSAAAEAAPAEGGGQATKRRFGPDRPGPALQLAEPSVDWNPPPADFDPLRASPEDRARYFLPQPPDAAAAPTALAHWKRAMSPPLAFVQQTEKGLSTLRPWGEEAGAAGPALVTQEASDNWSGAYIRTHDANRFVLIEAMWLVPNPYPPPGDRPGTPPAPGNYGSSIWIGLDGHDASSMSLPQIGTAQFVSVGVAGTVPQTYAWYQWWVRGQADDAPQQLNALPVAAGDLIYCRLEAVAPQRVNFMIKNQASGAALSFEMDAPVVQNPPPNSHDIIVEGRTAEWIVERPTQPHTMQLFTLPDYGATLFYACNTVSGTGAARREQQLQRARLVRMTDWDDPVRRGRTVSLPVRQTDSSTLVCYQGNQP
jgi:hypothetical protein